MCMRTQLPITFTSSSTRGSEGGVGRGRSGGDAAGKEEGGGVPGQL